MMRLGSALVEQQEMRKPGLRTVDAGRNNGTNKATQDQRWQLAKAEKKIHARNETTVKARTSAKLEDEQKEEKSA